MTITSLVVCYFKLSQQYLSFAGSPKLSTVLRCSRVLAIDGMHVRLERYETFGTGDWVSQCNSRVRVRVRVGQVNRVSVLFLVLYIPTGRKITIVLLIIYHDII